MLTRIHSVLIWTQDVKRLVIFYRDVLGLRPEMETDDFTVFGLDGAQLGVGAHSQVKGRSRDPDRVMVNFQVEDCRAEFGRLRERGVEFVREPGDEDGMIIATFLDPDGNTLQLFQEA